MTELLRATEIMRRPVVTFAGEDVGEVKDVVYAGTRGEVVGFTLNRRGLLAGPSKQALPWSGVHHLGKDAVMIVDETVLEDRDTVLARAQDGGGGDVLGSRVITDTGMDLGEVVEVIVAVGRTADVIGYEIESSEVVGRDHRKVLVPVPDTLAVSAEALIVPASAVDYISDDLTGFDAAVEAFRSRLHQSGTAQTIPVSQPSEPERQPLGSEPPGSESIEAESIEAESIEAESGAAAAGREEES